MTSNFNVELSCRALFGGLLTVALISAGLGAAAASARDEKRLKQAASYHTESKGNARCDNCLSRVSPPFCKVVAGIVGPSGRYIIYLEAAATQRDTATRCSPKG